MDQSGLIQTPTATPIDIRTETNPNVIEFVRADKLERGDTIVVNTTVYLITAITLYALAYANDGRVVRASGGFWNCLHILTNYGGLIRFSHEDVARLVRV